MTDSYRFYKKQLQILSWKFPNRRWLLKWALHLYHLEPLLKVFPDARIVQTHRDLLEVVPSLCSFACYLRGASSHSGVDPVALSKVNIEGISDLTEKARKFRETADPTHFLDIGYRDLVRAPLETVRRIYEYFGFEYSQVMENDMKRWLAENRQHKHGVHRYSLEQFGLNADDLHRKFASYYETYSRFL